MELTIYPWRNPMTFHGWTALMLIATSLSRISADPGEAQNAAPYVTKFGCNFYAPGSNQDVGSKTEKFTDIQSPIFGRQVEPMIFSSEMDLKDFIKKFTAIYSHVLTTYPYNSFDKYLSFYGDYKRSATNFKTFYQNYRPEYFPRTTCISLTIEVFDQAHYRLKDRWPQLASSTFLAPVKGEIPPQWENDLEKAFAEMKSQTGVDHAMMTKGIGTVLGVIRIKVQDREGYILADIGNYWERPVVLMFDGKPPHDAVIKDINTDDQFHFSLTLNNTHVLQKVVPEEFRADCAATHLVYLAPYCSFQEVTNKWGTLNMARAYIRREGNGKLKGGFYFTIKDTEGDPEMVFTKQKNFFGIFERPVKHRVPLSTFTPDEITHVTNIDEKTAKWLEEICQILGTDVETLKKKFEILHGNLQDKVFVKACFDMIEEVEKGWEIPSEEDTEGKLGSV